MNDESIKTEAMDDKIKAKAQEVRLALLCAVQERIDHARASNFPEDDIEQLANTLNVLDPSAHGIGSFGTLLASAQEIAPPGA